jgi:hypothetical protein
MAGSTSPYDVPQLIAGDLAMASFGDSGGSTGSSESGSAMRATGAGPAPASPADAHRSDVSLSRGSHLGGFRLGTLVILAIGVVAFLVLRQAPAAETIHGTPSPAVSEAEAVEAARTAVEPSATLITATITRFGETHLQAPDVAGDQAVWLVSFETHVPVCPPMPAPSATPPPCTFPLVRMDVVVDGKSGKVITASTH